MANVTKPLRLLSFDSGGISGLSSLLLLERLMVKLGSKGRPAKPCDCFDIMAGGSSGGLIAIMLGLLEMDISECIAVYRKFATMAFTIKPARKILGGLLSSLIATSCFDEQKLEYAVRSLLNYKGWDMNARLGGSSGLNSSGCKVLLLTSDESGKIAYFRTNYTHPIFSNDNSPLTLKDAILASFAAPGLFDPYTIDGQRFNGGGGLYSNAVQSVYKEAIHLYPGRPISCYVSLGVAPPPEYRTLGGSPLTLIKTLLKIATESEESHETFYSTHARTDIESILRNRYFRYSIAMQGTAQDHWQGQYSEVVSRVSAYVKNVDTQKGLAYCVARLKEVSALEELEHIKLSDRKFEYPAFFTNVDQYLGIYEASHFLPRQKLMDLLLDKVRTNRICTVVGIAGSGKTQLVLRFSKNLRHTYSAVLWFDASQPQNLRESYRQISDRLDLMPLGARRPLKPPVLQSLFEDDCLMAVNSWLYQRVGRRYLLVFDNCDADLSNHLRKCFPEGENGDIIVTSRDAEVLNSVADGLHGPLVEGLTTDEAIELLLHTENPTLTNEERVHAHEIVCMLDCHPLSVDLASEYMRRLRKTYLNGLTMAT